MKILSKDEIIKVCKEAWDEGKVGAPFPEQSLYDNMLATPLLEAQAKLTAEEIKGDYELEFGIRQHDQEGVNLIGFICSTLTRHEAFWNKYKE